MLTAQEYGLSPLQGTPKQIRWASDLRDRAIEYIWKQGWHGTLDSFKKDLQKLPTDAVWWIENRTKTESMNHATCHEAARLFLGLEYTTPAGSDY